MGEKRIKGCKRMGTLTREIFFVTEQYKDVQLYSQFGEFIISKKNPVVASENNKLCVHRKKNEIFPLPPP